MENIPVTVEIAFILTTGLTVGLFWRAAQYARSTLGILLVWLLVQGIVSTLGLYVNPTAMPPRLALALVPSLLVIAGLFLTQRGRAYLDGLRLETLTYLHLVRVPVELVLLGLYLYGVVPKRMTFEGYNWDIFSGLSAPVVYYVVFRRRQAGARLLLGWNMVCLLLLANVVVTAVLAVPSPVQQLAFDQPNIAVLYFPYSWLPSCVVPIVLLAHLAAIRRVGWPVRALL